MTEDLVRQLDGNTFVLSEENGDIDASPSYPTGLFSFDTRFLSRWLLSIDGERLSPLTVDEVEYFETRFVLVRGVPAPLSDPDISVIRERAVDGSLREQLTVINHTAQPIDVRVRVEAGSDFADLLEIKETRPKKGTLYARVDNGCLLLGYQRETFRRETVISSTVAARVDEQGLTYDVRIAPHSDWGTELRVRTLGADGLDLREALQGRPSRVRTEMRRDLDRRLADAPRLQCDWEPLTMTYRRSLVDLAALRFVPLTGAGQSLPAAGLPWFMCIFGRDSIFTSLQALPFAPDLAATTLRMLTLTQGTVLDDFREEEPGKIMHELRYGETVGFGEQPQSPYYGSADATPLFVILLDEYERWTGDADAVRACQGAA
ncbi:glycogen debranching N-terminal domain-containing protein, partial [Rugosimonospora africana]|uniref:glycogen debranching N-terminal domain-containing protein n=1 Tax=Rugosimonospora africana TaxID=556532 RepID=UPI0023B31F4E